MTDPILLEQVIALAERLDDGDRVALLEYLQQSHTEPSVKQFQLPIVHVGEWPENLSLHRADWYDDDGR